MRVDDVVGWSCCGALILLDYYLREVRPERRHWANTFRILYELPLGILWLVILLGIAAFFIYGIAVILFS